VSNSGELMTRTEIASLLTLVSSFTRRPFGEMDALRWQQDLAGYAHGECEAAVYAHAKHDRNGITPTVIVARIKQARRAKEARTPRAAADPAAERARAAAAGARGIAAVYAAMGWDHVPERSEGLSRQCPLESCRAAPGVRCQRLGRSRGGRAQSRDPRTGLHPARLAAPAEPADLPSGATA
jgi:hypothetical protein